MADPQLADDVVIEISQLPEDVVIEILIRLPVKYIVKVRCVCRRWRDLIMSPIFIHRHQNCERKHSVLLMKRCLTEQDGAEAILSFHQPDLPELLVSPNLSIPFVNDLGSPTFICTEVNIYGPCNGLVCIPVDDIILLCNPSLREFKRLPRLTIPCPNGYEFSAYDFGFGFDPNSGAYKVIQISELLVEEDDYYKSKTSTNYQRLDLYDSASNSWKQIDEKWALFVSGPYFQVLLGGVLHWIASTENTDDVYILCFDITTEGFQRLDYPDDFNKLEVVSKLEVLNENLAMIGCDNLGREPSQKIEIWVMKEYGVKESWTKQFVIGPYIVFSPLLFLNNEWLLFESNDDGGQLAVCRLHENQFKELQLYGFRSSFSAVVFEESLISLNDIISGDCEN